MTRIAELQKKYPTIPQSVLVKLEVTNRGVRDTDDLYKLSRWKRNAAVLYQSIDHDMTLKDAIENRPDRVKPGFIKRTPRNFYLQDGVGCDIEKDSRSDYEIRQMGEDRFALFEGEEKVDVDIYFPPRPSLKKDEPLTSKGNPLSSFLNYPCNLSPHCFQIVPLRFCEYFATGQQCRYCNFNGTKDDARSVGLNPLAAANVDETVEAYKIHSSRVRLLHGFMVGGGLVSGEKEAALYTKLVEGIAGGAPYKPALGACIEPIDRKSMERLRDSGLDIMTTHLEVWGKDLFNEVCPGKARHAPYETWMETLETAVDVFGVGSVVTCFVAGIGGIPENGHKTWQEERDSLAEGFRWSTKAGVWPIFLNARIPPNSIYGAQRANLDKLPPTEFHLEIALAHHEAMMEQDMFRKINKFAKCGLCHDAAYKGEMGMLMLAGDLGNWMADKVPFEMNKRAQFVESLKSQAAAK